MVEMERVGGGYLLGCPLRVSGWNWRMGCSMVVFGRVCGEDGFENGGEVTRVGFNLIHLLTCGKF